MFNEFSFNENECNTDSNFLKAFFSILTGIITFAKIEPKQIKIMLGKLKIHLNSLEKVAHHLGDKHVRIR